MGTVKQHIKISELQKQGYTWDKELSCSACAVILKKDNDIWFFGLDGEIEHNPKGLYINT